jgi:hypothetical protein
LSFGFVTLDFRNVALSFGLATWDFGGNIRRLRRLCRWDSCPVWSAMSPDIAGDQPGQRLESLHSKVRSLRAAPWIAAAGLPLFLAPSRPSSLFSRNSSPVTARERSDCGSLPFTFYHSPTTNDPGNGVASPESRFGWRHRAPVCPKARPDSGRPGCRWGTVAGAAWAAVWGTAADAVRGAAKVATAGAVWDTTLDTVREAAVGTVSDTASGAVTDAIPGATGDAVSGTVAGWVGGGVRVGVRVGTGRWTGGETGRGASPRAPQFEGGAAFSRFLHLTI